MYQIKELLKYKNLVHGVSTLEDGNMSFVKGQEYKIVEDKKMFLKSLYIDPHNKEVLDLNPIIRKPDKIVVVKNKKGFNFETLNPKAKPIFADSIVTNKKRIFFVLNLGDCFGIIFYEPKKNILALVHAGYIPVSHNIIAKTLKKLKRDFKISLDNLVTAITPGIWDCCLKYERIDRAELKTKKAKEYIYKKGKFNHIDLLRWILDDLRRNYINEIIVSNFCSACFTKKKFFSHIKQSEKKQKFGRNMLVVGMR
ncbi:MAG: laccase domain-containing protein [Patescibacteria group bacterium]